MKERSSYIVGTTIRLKALVSPPDSDTPEDAQTVTLDALVSGSTPETIASPDFTHLSTGVYIYALDTSTLAAGVWTYRVKTVTADGTSYEEDTFVLRAGV